MADNPLTRKYAVGILLLIMERGAIVSQDLYEIGSNYPAVRDVALDLCKVGLVTVRDDERHMYNRRIWELTPVGAEVSELLLRASSIVRNLGRARCGTASTADGFRSIEKVY